MSRSCAPLEHMVVSRSYEGDESAIGAWTEVVRDADDRRDGQRNRITSSGQQWSSRWELSVLILKSARIWRHVLVLSVLCSQAVARQLRRAGTLTISVSAPPRQCIPTTITWSGGASPFDFTIILGNGQSAPRIPRSPDTSFVWDTNVPAGTPVQFQVRGRDGALVQSGGMTVEPSDDSSCLGGNGGGISNGGGSSPTTTTPITTTQQITTSSPQAPPQTPPATSTPAQPPTTSPEEQSSPAPTSPAGAPTTESVQPSSSSPVFSDPSSSLGAGSNSGSTTDSAASSNATSSPTSTLPPGHTASSETSGQASLGASLSRTSATPTGPAELQPGSNGHGPNIGLIIGLVGGCVAIVLVLFAILYRRRKRRHPWTTISRYSATDTEAKSRSSRAVSMLKSDSSFTTEVPLHRLPLKSSLASSRQELSSVHVDETILEETESVVDIYPHALDSVIAQPTGINVHPPPRPSEQEKTPRPSREQDKQAKAVPTTSTFGNVSPPSPTSVTLDRAIPAHAPSQQRARAVREPSLSDPSDVETAAHRQIVYEFDGGVRLAGGPPGELLGETGDAREMALMLPPPYQRF